MQEMARQKIQAIRTETENTIHQMRQRQLDEARRLDAAIAEKRATLGTLMAHIEALRARGVEVAAHR
jgi:hypothetical protein